MADVELRLGGLITVGGHAIALGQTFALLDAIAVTRSVSGAAERLGLSYRTAWGRVEVLQAAFGRPLVAKVKGHGSHLTEAGLRLRAELGAVLEQFRGPLEAAETALAQSLRDLAAAAPRRLKVAVSHDPLALDVLGGLGDAVEVTVTGSAEAVTRLLAGEADLAGFHFGDRGPPGSPFTEAMADPTLAITAAFTREQGLLLRAGNPLGIRSLADLGAAGARMINRQRGSGTRLWFDRLLAEAGLSGAAIRGYAVEEFTHHAVAAVIASGAADAGMGVRAAAEQFGLAFVPLGEEPYYVGLRKASCGPWSEPVIAALRGRAGATRGYAPA